MCLREKAVKMSVINVISAGGGVWNKQAGIRSRVCRRVEVAHRFLWHERGDEFAQAEREQVEILLHKRVRQISASDQTHDFRFVLQTELLTLGSEGGTPCTFRAADPCGSR